MTHRLAHRGSGGPARGPKRSRHSRGWGKAAQPLLRYPLRRSRKCEQAWCRGSFGFLVFTSANVSRFLNLCPETPVAALTKLATAVWYSKIRERRRVGFQHQRAESFQQAALHREMLADRLDVAQRTIERAALRIDRIAADQVVEHADNLPRGMRRIDARQCHVDAFPLRQLLARIEPLPMPLQRSVRIRARCAQNHLR